MEKQGSQANHMLTASHVSRAFLDHPVTGIHRHIWELFKFCSQGKYLIWFTLAPALRDSSSLSCSEKLSQAVYVVSIISDG